jgi:hypothetical protein
MAWGMTPFIPIVLVICTIITSITPVFLAFLSAREERRAKGAEIARRQINDRLDTIHINVNSERSLMFEKLELMHAEILRLNIAARDKDIDRR